MNFILNLLKLDFLTGYRTLIGAIAALLTGLSGLALHFADPAHALALTPSSSIQRISTGLIGLGLKFKK